MRHPEARLHPLPALDERGWVAVARYVAGLLDTAVNVIQVSLQLMQVRVTGSG